jgi:hypothetical protein
MVLTHGEAEVLPPAQPGYSPTVRYTFVAVPVFGIAVPDRTLKPRWLSIDRDFSLAPGADKLRFRSWGVQDFDGAPHTKESADEAIDLITPSPVGSHMTYGQFELGLIPVVLHESEGFHGIMIPDATVRQSECLVEVLPPAREGYSRVVRYTFVVGSPLLGGTRTLTIDTDYDAMMQDGHTIEYQSRATDKPWDKK